MFYLSLTQLENTFQTFQSSSMPRWTTYNTASFNANVFEFTVRQTHRKIQLHLTTGKVFSYNAIHPNMSNF